MVGLDGEGYFLSYEIPEHPLYWMLVVGWIYLAGMDLFREVLPKHVYRRYSNGSYSVFQWLNI